jgi:hypothetical protein
MKKKSQGDLPFGAISSQNQYAQAILSVRKADRAIYSLNVFPI